MGWIDLKFKEQDEAAEARQESIGRAAQEHNARVAVASKAWERMVEALRADVQQYNAHPKAKKRVEIRVTQNPILVEVNWRGELRVLLHITRPAGEVVFGYSAVSFKASGAEQYSGEIAPTSENEFTLVDSNRQPRHIDVAKLSEELLSPVLFP